MKKRDEWLTQEAADKQFQRLIDEFNKAPGMLTGYEAAKLLGVEGNGSFYLKFRAWQGRQLASANGPVLEVPAEVVAQLRSSITEFGDTLLKAVVENIGSSTGIFSHNAELRVRDAQAKETTARRDGDQLGPQGGPAGFRVPGRGGGARGAEQVERDGGQGEPGGVGLEPSGGWARGPFFSSAMTCSMMAWSR